MSLSILNVGEGDTKLTFDKDNPAELERTRRIVGDMLKLGYAILVRVGETKAGKPKYRRAVCFDAERDEYLVIDVPADAQTGLDDGPPLKAEKLRRGRRSRMPGSTPAIGVARSAGGMSTAADSVEMQNLEHFDTWSHTRNGLRGLASMKDQWAGIPMPLEDADLVIEPRYPLAQVLGPQPTVKQYPEQPQSKIRNTFYSVHRRSDIIVWNEPDGKLQWGVSPCIHHFKNDMETMACSVAWGIEQESKALQLLASMLPHHAFKKYLLTGMFVEQSERSGVYYFFRRLKPTIAASGASGTMRILAALCMHPIAYYAGTWAGAMCPSDDVCAHLSLMRGDEALYWRRCNQHKAHRPEAGL
jgi:hypothetical protein